MRFDDTTENTESENTGEQPQSLNEALTGGESEFVVPEEKKSINKSTLALLALVVLGGGGLYLMHLRTGPSKAVAAESQEASKTISTFLSGGQTNIQSMEKALRDTEAVVKKFLDYPSTTQVPLHELRTNPFRRLIDEPADVPQSDVVQKRRKEEERQAVIKAVGNLQLQSVMAGGAQKACMINNMLIKEGQTVEQFTVEKITPNGVIVKNGQYRFELRMQR